MTPSTAAGKALLGRWQDGNLLNEVGMSVEQRILAIEAEARSEPLTLLRALVATTKRTGNDGQDIGRNVIAAGQGIPFSDAIQQARAYLATLPEQEVEG